MTPQELNSLYYGSMIAWNFAQSDHAMNLWRVAERERVKQKLPGDHVAFKHNRDGANRRAAE